MTFYTLGEQDGESLLAWWMRLLAWHFALRTEQRSALQLADCGLRRAACLARRSTVHGQQRFRPNKAIAVSVA